MEASERILNESRNENRQLKDEINSLNQRLEKMSEVNKDLASKLEAAELNSVNLERQILDLNLFQANHRDANRQEILLNGIKVIQFEMGESKWNSALTICLPYRPVMKMICAL